MRLHKIKAGETAGSCPCQSRPSWQLCFNRSPTTILCAQQLMPDAVNEDAPSTLPATNSPNER